MVLGKKNQLTAPCGQLLLSVTPLPLGSGQLLAELFAGPVEGRPSTGFSLRV